MSRLVADDPWLLDDSNFYGKLELELNGYSTSCRYCKQYDGYQYAGFNLEDFPGWRFRVFNPCDTTAQLITKIVPWRALNTFGRTARQLEKEWELFCAELSTRHESWEPYPRSG